MEEQQVTIIVKINKEQALKAIIHRRQDKELAPKEQLRQLSAAEREAVALDNGVEVRGRDRNYALSGNRNDVDNIMQTITTDFRRIPRKSQ